VLDVERIHRYALTTEETRMVHYIATDADLTAIYGIGDTADATISV